MKYLKESRKTIKGKTVIIVHAQVRIKESSKDSQVLSIALIHSRTPPLYIHILCDTIYIRI